MAVDDHLLEAEERMEKSLERLKSEYRTVRTGRASAGLVEHMKIDYYGTQTELRQMATITCPDPLMIVIKPYDASSVNTIAKAIQASDVGITPNSDGKVIRLQVPPLSEERRRQIVHQLKEMAEEVKVAMRNVRRDAIKAIDADLKAKTISEDDAKGGKDSATELIHKYEKLVDEALETKTKEVLGS
ncbi:MAG TPA: ribosome recycling factor [Phycisphaerae bacterium]|nr:ribosome recycling factor [Phycisphaerae bacterium]HOI54035.1 ribosome recycling factor [Phycisphaerae bacterium]